MYLEEDEVVVIKVLLIYGDISNPFVLVHKNSSYDFELVIVFYFLGGHVLCVHMWITKFGGIDKYSFLCIVTRKG